MSISECVCVCCPQGCMIQVDTTEDGLMSVRGNACARGVEYALAEVTRPKRILTMTVPAAGSLEPLSVKTSAPVPKEMISKVINEITQYRITLPVRLHEIIISNVCGLGVDIIATKELPINK